MFFKSLLIHSYSGCLSVFYGRKITALNGLSVVSSSLLLITSTTMLAQQSTPAQQPTSNVAFAEIDEAGYRIPLEGESEFDNHSDSYTKDWREAKPRLEYSDTEFGELMYNEASTPTKLEVLRLLSKDTPSIKVFLAAASMGLDIETVLNASVKYQPDQGREMAAAATNILPLLKENTSKLYSGYVLEDLERDDESKPYSVEVIANKFFDERLVLRPYPDWFQGQFHFMASAAELSRLQAAHQEQKWYQSKSTQDSSKRPIFVSLYEASKRILIDSQERISEALKADPNAELPIVFIFNRLNERSVGETEYPLTLKGTQDAFIEKRLMFTPAPEWQLGDHHFYVSMSEFYDVFNMPEQDDFEPQAWQALLSEAKDYSVDDTAFLVSMLSTPDARSSATYSVSGDVPGFYRAAQTVMTDGSLYAAWDDPRTEAVFPYVAADDGAPETLNSLLKTGVIVNRPDLLAALNALGVKGVPVAFYYVDSSRTKPYLKGPRVLLDSVVGPNATADKFGGGGITPAPPPVIPPVCASPPCTE